MQNQDRLGQLADRLARCTASIGYKPLSGEVVYAGAPFPKNLFSEILIVPQDATVDPFEWAEKSILFSTNRIPCIFIPGKVFDTSGTRHGRGRGWYDRFLAKIPREWSRIGITDSSLLSSSPLVRQSWDEPVDWVVAHDSLHSSWQAFETFARD
jgi:5-formyltetrahydrofolate cyclo-ligase family